LSSLFKGCDYLGEKLATFFGITTPKYEAEIEEYNRMMEKEKKRKEKLKEEYAGWVDPNTSDISITSDLV